MARAPSTEYRPPGTASDRYAHPSTSAGRTADALSVAADLRKAFAETGDQGTRNLAKAFIAEAAQDRMASASPFWQRTIEAGKALRQATGPTQELTDAPRESRSLVP